MATTTSTIRAAAAAAAAIGALALLPAGAGAATVEVDPGSLTPGFADSIVGGDGTLIRLRLEGDIVSVHPQALPAVLARAIQQGVKVRIEP
jgi:hypothetical protein